MWSDESHNQLHQLPLQYKSMAFLQNYDSSGGRCSGVAWGISLLTKSVKWRWWPILMKKGSSRRAMSHIIGTHCTLAVWNAWRRHLSAVVTFLNPNEWDEIKRTVWQMNFLSSNHHKLKDARQGIWAQLPQTAYQRCSSCLKNQAVSSTKCGPIRY